MALIHRSIIVLTALVLILPSVGTAQTDELNSAPAGMILNLWLQDPRWEWETPSHDYHWESETEGIDVTTSCDWQFQRSNNSGHAIILVDCSGQGDAAVVFVFLDNYTVLWGKYERVVRAMQRANYALSTGRGAGKLVAYEGTFERVEKPRTLGVASRPPSSKRT